MLRVSEVELENAISAGVSLRILGPGMVPLHEEHEARLERGIGLESWAQMEMQEKALLIANRRIRIALANLQAEAEIRAMKKGAKASGKSRR